MNVDSFAKIIAMHHGGKKRLSIAQIKEILKIIRSIFLKTIGKDFYRIIKET